MLLFLVLHAKVQNIFQFSNEFVGKFWYSHILEGQDVNILLWIRRGISVVDYFFGIVENWLLGWLGSTFHFRHNVNRAVLALVEDAPQVFADDPERQQLGTS